MWCMYVKSGLYVCLCACVERLACVWKDWAVFGGELCVYVSVEGEMWGVKGERGLYEGVFV